MYLVGWLRLNQVVETKAWNSITFNPITVLGNNVNGGTLTARARNEIHVQGESRFKRGSSVHLYLEDVFSDCMDFAPFHEVTKRGHALLATDEANHFIEIGFKKKNGINSEVQINPNPASNYSTVVLKSPVTKNSIIELLTPEGQILQSINITEQSTAIDISALPKGIYFIAYYSETLSQTLKLIVQ